MQLTPLSFELINRVGGNETLNSIDIENDDVVGKKEKSHVT